MKYKIKSAAFALVLVTLAACSHNSSNGSGAAPQPPPTPESCSDLATSLELGAVSASAAVEKLARLALENQLSVTGLARCLDTKIALRCDGEGHCVISEK